MVIEFSFSRKTKKGHSEEKDLLGLNSISEKQICVSNQQCISNIKVVRGDEYVKWTWIQKALELLNKLLNEYNIPNEKSKDGITRIDGLTVEEYFNQIGLFNDIIDDKYDIPTQDIENIIEINYDDNEILNEFILAA